MNQQRETDIGKNTKLTLGVVLAIVALVGPGIFEWADTRSQLSELRREQWTVNNQLHWIGEFQKLNPDINIPIPNERQQASFATNRIMQASAINK